MSLWQKYNASAAGTHEVSVHLELLNSESCVMATSDNQLDCLPSVLSKAIEDAKTAATFTCDQCGEVDEITRELPDRHNVNDLGGCLQALGRFAS